MIDSGGGFENWVVGEWVSRRCRHSFFFAYWYPSLVQDCSDGIFRCLAGTMKHQLREVWFDARSGYGGSANLPVLYFVYCHPTCVKYCLKWISPYVVGDLKLKPALCDWFLTFRNVYLLAINPWKIELLYGSAETETFMVAFLQIVLIKKIYEKYRLSWTVNHLQLPLIL